MPISSKTNRATNVQVDMWQTIPGGELNQFTIDTKLLKVILNLFEMVFSFNIRAIQIVCVARLITVVVLLCLLLRYII